MLDPLPKSENKFWQYSDKHSIDVSEIPNLLCKRHKFDLYRDKRELTCSVCGLTGRFTPTTLDIDEKEKLIKIKATEHDLSNIF